MPDLLETGDTQAAVPCHHETPEFSLCHRRFADRRGLDRTMFLESIAVSRSGHAVDDLLVEVSLHPSSGTKVEQ
jgi:hypothetical protein